MSNETKDADLADIHLYSASREELIEHVESAIAKVAELEEELENAVKRGDEFYHELREIRKEDDSESTSWEIAIDRDEYRELQERDKELEALTYVVEEVNGLLKEYAKAKDFNSYDLQECLENLLNKVDDLCSFDWNDIKNK